jgi:prepilin-type N-terminal cleavage/methylation domain-containing protein
MQGRRLAFRGFTIVELLVVVAIIGTLVALLLPAVQSTREAARRGSCQNNLRQIGIGFHNYEAARGFFPTTVNISGGARHYWVAQILPYMEENPLSSIYDYSVAFSDVKNQTAVQYPLPFLRCASTPGGPIADPKFKTGTPSWGSVGSDYAGSAGVASAQWSGYILYPEPVRSDGFFNGSIKSVGGRGLGVKDVVDGTSQTLAVFESAGRPQVWYSGRMVPGSGLVSSSSSLYVGISGWPNINAFAVRGYTIDLSQSSPTSQYSNPGPRMVNGCNYYSVYSFHPGGAAVMMVDGSTRFMADTVTCDTVASLLTIAGAEVVQLP